MIDLQRVSKRYRFEKSYFYAAKDVSFKIKTGEFVSILGPSGSGKSTLMHLIGGLDQPDSGRVVVDGADLSKLSSGELARYRNRSVGFVFQFFYLVPELSALENVMQPLIYSRESQNRKEKAKQLLDAVGLSKKLTNKPNQLSGGEQQRVAVARALVTDPDIILADEPTGNLDSKNGKKIVEQLVALNRRGKTLILVTHEAEIAKKADRIFVIKDGRLIK